MQLQATVLPVQSLHLPGYQQRLTKTGTIELKIFPQARLQQIFPALPEVGRLP